MCSICGIAEKGDANPDLSSLIGMLRDTRHRGPDGCGFFQGGRAFHASDPESLAQHVPVNAERQRVILAQSRLAIVGNMRARQPFVSDDGKLALAHNGEIYNHHELARVLGPSVRLETGCDSEVLMRVLEDHYGGTGGDLAEAMRRTLGSLTGMFAIAVTDGTQLVLARDIVGKKPLYYVDGKDRLAWASERKALVELARDQDVAIERLAPGDMLTMDAAGATSVESFARLELPPIDIVDEDEALETYERALTSAIQRRTRDIDRAAVFFSGGVDSVLVARLLQREGIDVTGYVSGVEGSSDIQNAIEVAREMGLPVKVATVDAETCMRDLPEILRAIELHGPLMAEVSFPMWYAAKAAHEDGHRVVFSGQAADEVWAGYDWYRDTLGGDGPLALHSRMWEDVLALPLDTLEREDRITMAWSLEGRCPFLDLEVIRAAMRVEPALKIHGADDGFRKHPHREIALRAGVPRSIAYREKVPAQDGANVHDLLERMAEAKFPGDAPQADVPDFGSLYRYRYTLESYSTPKVRALLAAIAEEHGFVVAAQDGSAVPPRVPVKPREAKTVVAAKAV